MKNKTKKLFLHFIIPASIPSFIALVDVSAGMVGTAPLTSRLPPKICVDSKCNEQITALTHGLKSVRFMILSQSEESTFGRENSIMFSVFLLRQPFTQQTLVIFILKNIGIFIAEK